MVERLNMIWSHIEEFHVWWKSLKNFQFSMGRGELPVWWYDPEFLLADMFFHLVVMYKRRHLIEWDHGILWNGNPPQVARKFVTL